MRLKSDIYLPVGDQLTLSWLQKSSAAAAGLFVDRARFSFHLELSDKKEKKERKNSGCQLARDVINWQLVNNG